MVGPFSLLPEFPILFLHEIVIPSFDDPLFGQPGITPIVAGIIDGEFNEVAGMAGVGGDTEFSVAIFPEMIEDLLIERNPLVFAYPYEDGLKFLLRRVADVDFVSDPPKEGFVHQGFGLDISAEDDEFVERDFKLHPGVQGHEVNPAFEGDNPPV